jgi:predicted nucleotidyltransferase
VSPIFAKSFKAGVTEFMDLYGVRQGRNLMLKKHLEQHIISALKPFDPEKVILFGSYARNESNEESDVDVYIVSKEDYMPASYAENMQHYKKYSRSLKELKKLIPVDVLVHTRAMNRLFEESNSAFSREILLAGERLL